MSTQTARTIKQALAPDEGMTHRKPDLGLMRRLWGYLRPYRKYVWLTIVLSLAASGLRVVQPVIAMTIIDEHIAAGDVPGVVRMAAILLGVILLGGVLEMLFQFVTSLVGQWSMHDMRNQLIRNVLRQDTVFFDRNPVGRLITRITSDVGTLNDLFATGVVTVLGELIVLGGVLGVMFYFNWQLSLVVLCAAPFILTVAYYFRHTTRKWYLETRRALATMNAYLQENVAGMRTVQSYGREALNHRQFVGLNGEYRNAILHTIFAFSLFFPAIWLISTLTVTAVIWAGGRQLLAGVPGGEAMTFGQLFLFIQSVQMLFHPIRTLSEKYNLLQSAMASSERIFKLLDNRPRIIAPDGAPRITRIEQGLRFEDVHFAYVPDEPVLRGVSFEVPRGATVAVVGATGAGKSTLINLMTRFYDVGSGRITLDGHDIRELDLMALRRLYAVVLQEVFLFSGTVADNIRLARPELTDDQVWAILREVNAHDFVASLEGGLEAEVTERGGTFSTGQKQLLSFARALAADPQVLILDEATANIDTETEWRIQEATQRLLVDRTALVIAHRLSTIQRADRILVMHHGRLAESGTHEELLASDGLYRRLYEMQYRHAATTP